MGKELGDKEKLTVLAMSVLLGVLLICFGMFLGYKMNHCDHFVETSDTIVMHDTVTIREWDTVTSQVVKYQRVPCLIRDTVTMTETDTVWLEMERVQRHYHEDSVADIWVSGVYPELDSAKIVNKTIVERHTIVVTEPKNSVGLIQTNLSSSIYYSRNMGNFQLGGTAGIDFSRKPVVGISAGFRF